MLAYGRPAIIPEDHVRIELPMPYTQHVPTAVPAPPRECLSVAFYNATISLYSIIGKILFQCYGGNLGYEQKLSPYDLVTRLAPIEQQLTGWRYGLPQDLTLHFFGNLNLYNTEFSLSERMKTMLTLRYHNVRLLLHRPVLIAFLDQSGSFDPPSQDLQLLLQVDPNSFHTCIGSASEIVSIVKAMLSSTGLHRMLLGAWWYTLYYSKDASHYGIKDLETLTDLDSFQRGSYDLRLASRAQRQRSTISVSTWLDHRSKSYVRGCDAGTSNPRRRQRHGSQVRQSSSELGPDV